MKLKGLAKAMEIVKLLETTLEEKADLIQWDGDHDISDQQKDEMYNEAFDCINEAIVALEKVKELQLDDF